MVAIYNIVDNGLFVLISKIKNCKDFNAKMFGYFQSAISVLSGMAVRIGLVGIVFHKSCDDVMSLLKKECCGDC